MDRVLERPTVAITNDRAYQSQQLLQWGFVVAATIAGLDKFFNLLTQWEKYLPSVVAGVLPISAPAFMMVVGLIELFAAALLIMKPRIGGYVLATWLGAITLNLIVGGWYDLALRDFGLMLGALALARLSGIYDPPRREVSQP